MSNQALPRPRFNAPEPERGSKAALKIEARTAPLLQGKVSEIPDAAFGWAMRLCGLAVVALLGLIVYQLVVGSAALLACVWLEVLWPIGLESGRGPVRRAAFHVRHDRVFAAFAGYRGAAVDRRGGFYYRDVPVGLRGILSFTTELLAAIPSVVYGLWAIFVLVPILRAYVQPFLAKTLGWTGLFSGPPYGIGMLAAGVILAIMIIPIISSITREVLTVVPQHQREAVLALGATRWEMIRMGVLRNARAGIVGAIILGLGRALGETMAVTMVIGNRPEIAKSLFAPGYTMASVLANEFTEATGDLYLSALIEIGLALFFVTIVVNALARLMVWSVTRGQPARSVA